MPEQYDLLEDALRNTELVIHWSSDPDTTRGLYARQESAIWRLWLKELGIKQIFIDPTTTPQAASWLTNGLAPRPGTDAAMAEADRLCLAAEETYTRITFEPDLRI